MKTKFLISSISLAIASIVHANVLPIDRNLQSITSVINVLDNSWVDPINATSAQAANAEVHANSAESTANSANQNAVSAQQTAVSANATAQTVATTVNTLNERLSKAENNVINAQSTAISANTTASEAKSDASDAENVANTAKAAADNSDKNAAEAKQTADNAQQVAEAAKASADKVDQFDARISAAESNSTAAKSIAEATAGKLPEYDNRIGAVEKGVSEAEQTADNAKQTADNAKQVAETAKASADKVDQFDARLETVETDAKAAKDSASQAQSAVNSLSESVAQLSATILGQGGMSDQIKTIDAAIAKLDEHTIYVQAGLDSKDNGNKLANAFKQLEKGNLGEMTIKLSPGNYTLSQAIVVPKTLAKLEGVSASNTVIDVSELIKNRQLAALELQQSIDITDLSFSYNKVVTDESANLTVNGDFSAILLLPLAVKTTTSDFSVNAANVRVIGGNLKLNQNAKLYFITSYNFKRIQIDNLYANVWGNGFGYEQSYEGIVRLIGSGSSQTQVVIKNSDLYTDGSWFSNIVSDLIYTENVQPDKDKLLIYNNAILHCTTLPDTVTQFNNYARISHNIC